MIEATASHAAHSGVTRRGIPLKSAPEYCGFSRNTLYREHADDMAGGGEGFLVKCGRCTVLDVAAWERWLARRPRLVNRSDRRPRKGDAQRQQVAA